MDSNKEEPGRSDFTESNKEKKFKDMVSVVICLRIMRLDEKFFRWP